LQTRPDAGEPEAVVFEFTLVRSRALSTDHLLSLAQAVAQGASDAGYHWDVVGVLVDPVDPFPRVQVVAVVTEWTFTGTIGNLGSKVQDAILARGLGDGIGAWAILEVDGPEARYFSPAGGVGALVTVVGGKATYTKAASGDLRKQLLRGDIRSLASASPFGLASSVAAVLDKASTSTTTLLAIGAGVAVSVALLGALWRVR
jgi:hypothetical protein